LTIKVVASCKRVLIGEASCVFSDEAQWFPNEEVCPDILLNRPQPYAVTENLWAQVKSVKGCWREVDECYDSFLEKSLRTSSEERVKGRRHGKLQSQAREPRSLQVIDFRVETEAMGPLRRWRQTMEANFQSHRRTDMKARVISMGHGRLRVEKRGIVQPSGRQIWPYHDTENPLTTFPNTEGTESMRGGRGMRNTIPSDSDIRDNHSGGAESSWSGGVVAAAIIIQRIGLKRCSGWVESHAILPTRPQFL